MAVETDIKGHGQKLSRHGERVLAALLQHPTVAEAAKASGISERTIFRWLQREEFQARYRAAQRAVLDDALGELQAATAEAVRTLRRNLTSPNPFLAMTAAKLVLTHSFKAVEMYEMQGRIEQLEQLLAAQADTHGRRRA